MSETLHDRFGAHDDGFTREHVVSSKAGQRPRVCLFSTFNEAYAPLADIARPNWTEYCVKNGYALRFYPGEFHLDPTRPETYGDKIKHRLYYDLRGHCDIVVFLDIDSLFMNHDIRVEDTLNREVFGAGTYMFYAPRDLSVRDTRFLWTYDDSGPLSGLWIARTDDVTERHLRHAYELAAIESNVRRGVIEPNGISDQDAMRRLMNVPPFSSTFGNCRDAREVGHTFPETYYDGAWIIGFPGMPVEDKLAAMKEWSAKWQASSTHPACS
jgi:hypothetical protein